MGDTRRMEKDDVAEEQKEILLASSAEEPQKNGHSVTSSATDAPMDGHRISSEIDGGWGWMIVVGCALMHFLLGGWTRCYGVFYIKMRERYSSSAAITAWVGGVGTAIRMGGSPIATALANRFSVKSVAFVGGVLLSAGIMLAGFSPSVEFMFLPIGLLAGFGGTLVYSPAIVHVGHYFNKKRGIATGLSTAGSGLGVFVFPPLVELLFYQYGFTSTFLIVGAAMLNTCVAALLYRPLSPETMRTINNSRSSKKGADVKTEELTGLRKYLDYKLLTDYTFLSFAISLGLVTTSYISSQMLVPAQAVHFGVDETKASLLLSVIGISDTIGRLSSGFIFDFPRIRPIRLHIYNACILLTSATIFGWAFSTTFTSLLVFCVLHGLVNGLVVSQRAVVVADVMGVEKLSSSFGLTVFCQGIGALIGPLVAGYLRDVTGEYVMSFVFTALCSVVAFFVYYSGHIYTKRKARKEKIVISSKTI